MSGEPDRSRPSPEVALESFLARFDPTARTLIRSVREALRQRFPTAFELAYDYSSHVVLSYSPTERGIDGIVSFDARPDGFRLYFNQGPRLPDPKKLLRGSAKQVRYLELSSVDQLAEPDVEALMRAAIELASVPLPAEGSGALLIRGAAAKPRPRRPTAE